MDDVWDDVIIARPLDTDPWLFFVWCQYFDATFVITACILMLAALEIYAAIDIDVLGFVWGFRQSFFMIRLILPKTQRNVVFDFVTSQLEIN